ncbi:3'-5' exonuclease [Irineochytrium annulatum]|nr:3'-5' exonuclease [Irineochytrium annulatum]
MSGEDVDIPAPAADTLKIKKMKRKQKRLIDERAACAAVEELSQRALDGAAAEAARKKRKKSKPAEEMIEFTGAAELEADAEEPVVELPRKKRKKAKKAADGEETVEAVAVEVVIAEETVVEKPVDGVRKKRKKAMQAGESAGDTVAVVTPVKQKKRDVAPHSEEANTNDDAPSSPADLPSASGPKRLTKVHACNWYAALLREKTYVGVQDPVAKWFKAFDADKANSYQYTLSALDPLDVICPPSVKAANGTNAKPPDPSMMVSVDCEMVLVAVEPESAAAVPVVMPAQKTVDGFSAFPYRTVEGLPTPPAPVVPKIALARVSIVDFSGNVILDTFAKPKERVIDYKTRYSGVTAEDLEHAPSVKRVQKQVAKILKGRYIVGQSLENDLGVLDLTVPFHMIRDTALFYKRFHPRGKSIGLKDLAKLNLGLQIQQGEHDSIVDSRVTMLIYRQVRNIWERIMPVNEPPKLVEPGVYIPCPLSFPSALRESLKAIADTPADVRAPPVVVHELPMPTQGIPTHPLPVTMPPLQFVTSATGPSAFMPSSLTGPPTAFSTAAGLIPQPKEKFVPIVTGLDAAAESTLSSDMVRSAFYSWMPKTKGLMRFKSFPMLMVGEGEEVAAEGMTVDIGEVRKLVRKQGAKKKEEGGEGKEVVRKVKVDTSKPGKRKLRKLEAERKKVKDGEEEGKEDEEEDEDKVKKVVGHLKNKIEKPRVEEQPLAVDVGAAEDGCGDGERKKKRKRK